MDYYQQATLHCQQWPYTSASKNFFTWYMKASTTWPIIIIHYYVFCIIMALFAAIRFDFDSCSACRDSIRFDLWRQRSSADSIRFDTWSHRCRFDSIRYPNSSCHACSDSIQFTTCLRQAGADTIRAWDVTQPIRFDSSSFPIRFNSIRFVYETWQSRSDSIRFANRHADSRLISNRQGHDYSHYYTHTTFKQMETRMFIEHSANLASWHWAGPLPALSRKITWHNQIQWNTNKQYTIHMTCMNQLSSAQKLH